MLFSFDFFSLRVDSLLCMLELLNDGALMNLHGRNVFLLL